MRGRSLALPQYTTLSKWRSIAVITDIGGGPSSLKRLGIDAQQDEIKAGAQIVGQGGKAVG
jgi:hypothetical protein